MDVCLQASAAGNPPNVLKWAAPDVHMVLKVGNTIIQPLSEADTPEHVEIPAGQAGIVSQHGNALTYVSLYETYLGGDITSATTWFTFPKPTEDFEVEIIAADGLSEEMTASLDLIR